MTYQTSTLAELEANREAFAPIQETLDHYNEHYNDRAYSDLCDVTTAALEHQTTDLLINTCNLWIDAALEASALFVGHRDIYSGYVLDAYKRAFAIDPTGTVAAWLNQFLGFFG